ncbi:MAG: protein kinase [Gemmatimonadota bacterium]|nr:MAG: protein kinase [Gemmatimonadota bacterium]
MTEHSDRLRSALADRYAIEHELGSGGMAVVYLAGDLRHDRQVAVKVLRPELAAAMGGDRFLREIKLTAKLNHPHILPLLDSGEADGFLYYVMPYVAGESLRGRLERETQLPVDEALRITQQVASALDFAHRQDVIHRDIKPENILLHEGEAMVADFGIALAVSAARGQRLTETGVSVGTPEYMSPEQALGEGEPDARSDIYSLGCVLYETLVGEPPYTGPTAMAVLAKRLSDPVPSARRLRAAIPEPMDAALLRALAKERADRFGSAGEFAEALAAEAAEETEAVKSIVVLPFENLSPDPDNAFFADGLTEELIADLSKLRALRVISRTSAMAFKGTSKKVPEIAEELNVRYVLEGSVRRAANSVRITAQLIEAATDAHLWAEKYSGTLDAVFDMQEQVSRAIVDALELELTGVEDRQIAKRPIADARAYDCYLRARAAIWHVAEGGLDEAARNFEEGLAIVGDNALLYAGLAHVWLEYVRTWIKHEDELARAEDYANRALSLDPDTALACVVLGVVEYLRGKGKEGLPWLKRAHILDPNDHEIHHWSGWAYILAGRTSSAFPLAQRMIELDPLNPLNVFLGIVHFYAGQFNEAVELASKFESPAALDLPWYRWWAAYFLVYAERPEEALDLLEPIERTTATDLFTQNARFLRYALRGERDRIPELLTDTFVAQERRDAAVSCWAATCYAMLDDYQQALDWLENAVDRGFLNYPYLAEHDPFLAKFRDEPQFKELMVRVKREWEQLEV